MNQDQVLQLKDGRMLGYAEYGDIHGKPVFYFHGWPTSRLQAQGTDVAAKKLRVRVISIDRPGYGLSEFKANRTLLDWPNDVVELANHLKLEKFAVMGVSGGGPYAAVCGYKIPERLTKVGIVVGLSPTYIPGVLEGMTIANKFFWANYHRSSLLRTLAALSHYLNMHYGPGMGLYRFMSASKTDKKILADVQLTKILTKNFKEAFRSGYKGAALDLKLYTRDWKFNLNKISVKTLLFYGVEDRNVPLNMGEYYASQIPNSTLVTYEGEGHLISGTHIEEILSLLVS